MDHTMIIDAVIEIGNALLDVILQGTARGHTTSPQEFRGLASSTKSQRSFNMSLISTILVDKSA